MLFFVLYNKYNIKNSILSIRNGKHIRRQQMVRCGGVGCGRLGLNGSICLQSRFENLVSHLVEIRLLQKARRARSKLRCCYLAVTTLTTPGGSADNYTVLYLLLLTDSISSLCSRCSVVHVILLCSYITHQQIYYLPSRIDRCSAN